MPPLVRQNVPISLASGPDTKSDPLQVNGKLLVLENATFQTPKRITRRNGHNALTQTVTAYTTPSFSVIPNSVAAGKILTPFLDETVLLDGFNVFSYAPASSTWVWKGTATLCAATTQTAGQGSTSKTNADSITFGGYEYVAYVDASAGLSAAVIDTVTRNIVWTGVVAAGGIQPRWAILSNATVMLFFATTAGALEYSVFTPTAGTPVSVASDLRVQSSKVNYDACTLSTGNVVVAYDSTANTNNEIKAINFATLTSTTTFVLSGHAASGCIGIWPDTSGQTWVAYQSSSNVAYFIINAAFNATVLGATAIQSVTGATHITGLFNSGTQSHVFYDFPGSLGGYSPLTPNAFISWAPLTTTAAGMVSTFLNSVSLASKAWGVTFGGSQIPHVLAIHDSALQPEYFLLSPANTSTGYASVGARIQAGGEGIGTSIAAGKNLPGVSAVGTAFRMAIEIVTPGFEVYGVVAAQFDFGVTNQSAVALGQNLMIGSGQVQMYDGLNVVEHGFHLYPEYPAITSTTTGGALQNGATYGYQYVYSWTDAQGQVHRSSPSIVSSISTGGSGATAATSSIIPTLRVTNKTGVYIEVYRTLANGSVYFLVGTVANDPTTNSGVTFSDTLSDSSIEGNRQLYTTGGEVENICAPAAQALCIYMNRVILISSEDPTQWWYSKQVLPGSPVEFSDLFTENVSTDGGGMTACAQMDSNLILFKEKTIFYVQGQGPSPNGTNNDLTEALEVAADCGCTQAPSVTLMPEGLMFQGGKGFYLLNRSLAVSYVGADVETYNSQNCTSGTLINNTTQVRFTMSGNVILVFDYLVQQWSAFTCSNSGLAAVSGCNDPVTNLFQFVSPAGIVLRETVGAGGDAANSGFMHMRTGWLSVASIQGFQRARRLLLLAANAAHTSTVTISISYDFASTPSQTDTVSIPASSSPTQWMIHLAQQKCEAIQIDIIQTDSFAGLSISALTFEMGLKKGLRKTPAASQVG
jgi:hypothetical protein